MSSTFQVPMVKIRLLPHPNADTLSLVPIYGYQVVVKTAEWVDKDLAAWVPPDSVVPNTPTWEWLEGKRRITTRRFRGEWSHGLLIPYPLGRLGEDVADKMGITPYEHPSIVQEGPSTRRIRRGWRGWWDKLMLYIHGMGIRPPGFYPHYDMENYRMFSNIFEKDEPVMVTEKIHGANAMYVCHKDLFGRKKIYLRSRTLWKRRLGYHKGSWWEKALDDTPNLSMFLLAHPGWVVFGEVYGGGVQKLTYGVDSPHFVAFDICTKEDGWMNQRLSYHHFEEWGVPTAPMLERGYYLGFQWMLELLDKPTSDLALRNGKKQMIEGIVIQSLKSRKILKLVSDKYLESRV